MAKIRGQYGQFAQIGSEERKVRSLRLTDSTWEALGQIAEEKEATRADLVEELAATYYTASDDSQPSNTWEKELEELREWKARAESRLRESDGWQEQLTQLQRANLRNSGEAEKAEERAQSAEARVKELEEMLKAIETERDELDRECNQLHAQHGDTLNEIELLKEQLTTSHLTENALQSEIDLTVDALQLKDAATTVNALQSESAAPTLNLPEPAILLNQLKGKHPKTKVSLKDIEAILGLLEG